MIGFHIREALRGFAVLAFLGAVIFLALRCQGCREAEDAGAQQRAVVHALAHGVRVADLTCASMARSAPIAKEGYELARDCAFAYDAARVSLDAADDALDRDGDVACEVAQALAYANQMAALIEKRGGKLPKALVQAFTLAPMLARGCA